MYSCYLQAHFLIQIFKNLSIVDNYLNLIQYYIYSFSFGHKTYSTTYTWSYIELFPVLRDLVSDLLLLADLQLVSCSKRFALGSMHLNSTHTHTLSLTYNSYDCLDVDIGCTSTNTYHLPKDRIPAV